MYYVPISALLATFWILRFLVECLTRYDSSA